MRAGAGVTRLLLAICMMMMWSGRALAGQGLLATGSAHSLAVAPEGSVWGWGSSAMLGAGLSVVQPTPARVALPCRFSGPPALEPRAGGPRRCHVAP